MTTVDLDNTFEFIGCRHEPYHLADLVQQREDGPVLTADDPAQRQRGKALLVDDEREDGQQQFAVTDLVIGEGRPGSDR